MAISTVGKLRFNPTGTWVSGSSYVVDDIVTYKNEFYVCYVANSSTTTPNLNTSQFNVIGGGTYSTGAWSSGTAYGVGDMCTYTTTNPYNNIYNYQDKNTWIALVANSNSTPGQSVLTTVVIAGTAGQFTCAAAALTVGDLITFTGTFGGTGSITNYISGTKYKVSAITTGTYPSVTAFTVVTLDNVALVTTAGTPTGLTYTNNSPLANVNWRRIGTGTGREKFSYLGGVNEGYIADYKQVWDTYSLANAATPVGMGDSFGEFKTPGTASMGNNGFMWVNKRYALVNYGDNYLGHGGTATSGDPQVVPAEASFINNSWFDNSSPTIPATQKPRVIQVETDQHNATLVLFDNGEVHYSGYNGHGNRGEGTTNAFRHFMQCGYSNVNRTGATTILRGKKVIRIACSANGNDDFTNSNYALVRNTDNTRELYAWGYNGYGQLANGNTTDLYVPTLVSWNAATNGNIIEIWACGGNYASVFLLTDTGKMFGCGYNAQGQLGIGNVTNQSTFQLTKTWGTGATNRVKKFNTNNCQSNSSFLVVRGDNTLWTWGHNGYGQLGHNNIYVYAFPTQVYTGGYSGATDPVIGSGTQGTAGGSAITDCWNAWMCGGNGYGYINVARGASASSNTLYACGYNGYYNLSVSAATTTNYSTLQPVVFNNGTAMTNVSDVTSNNGNQSSYISHAVRRSNGDWFWGAYNGGGHPLGNNDGYNARRSMDPNNNADDTNFRLKNNGLFPSVRSDRTYWKAVLGGYSSVKNCFHVDLKTGQVYINSQNNTYYVFNTGTGSGISVPSKIKYT